CTGPTRMLEFLRACGKLSDRKARLFGVACCRRISALFHDDRLGSALAIMERFAEEQATPADRKAARRAAQLVQQAGGGILAGRVSAAVFGLGQREAHWGALAAAHHAAEAWAAARTEWLSPEWRAELRVERADQGDLVRDLFGPEPFRPVEIDPL